MQNDYVSLKEEKAVVLFFKKQTKKTRKVNVFSVKKKIRVNLCFVGSPFLTVSPDSCFSFLREL